MELRGRVGSDRRQSVHALPNVCGRICHSVRSLQEKLEVWRIRLHKNSFVLIAGKKSIAKLAEPQNREVCIDPVHSFVRVEQPPCRISPWNSVNKGSRASHHSSKSTEVPLFCFSSNELVQENSRALQHRRPNLEGGNRQLALMLLLRMGPLIMSLFSRPECIQICLAIVDVRRIACHLRLILNSSLFFNGGVARNLGSILQYPLTLNVSSESCSRHANDYRCYRCNAATDCPDPIRSVSIVGDKIDASRSTKNEIADRSSYNQRRCRGTSYDHSGPPATGVAIHLAAPYGVVAEDVILA